jgi:benzoyl-CoA reductase/2-hydroxyglutaryl-CoA dehydratase subunit BcrC/BadD/HgdB
MSQITVDNKKREEQLKNLLDLTKETGTIKKSPFFTLKASQKRAQLITNLFLQAYDKNSRVAFRNVIMPTEIFYAMNIIPLCVETVCALFASSGISHTCLETAEHNEYSRDICSFTRCTLGAALEEYLPTPDLLACTSYYCDDSKKLFYALSKKYNKKLFLLDVPYSDEDEQAVDYLEFQLKSMTEEIEKITNKKMDPGKLKETIGLSNEARHYFTKVNELRMHVPSPVPGGEAIDYAALLASTWGSREIVDIYKTLYEEVKEKTENPSRSEGNPRIRILWRHLRPYYNDTLFNFIENECGADIAFEEVNCIHWDEMDPDDPYRSLARKLITNPGVGDIQRWINVTLDFIDKYAIDGVISFNHWGCRQLCSTEGILKDILTQKGVPLIQIGGDCIDKRDFSFQQLKTRIQAFLEMIEENKT